MATTQKFFILKGSISHVSGKKRPGEVIELEFLEAKELIKKGLVKKHQPEVDVVIDYSKETTKDVLGRDLPTLEEYTSQGFEPGDYAAYIAKVKAAAVAASTPTIVDDTKKDQPNRSSK